MSDSIWFDAIVLIIKKVQAQFGMLDFFPSNLLEIKIFYIKFLRSEPSLGFSSRKMLRIFNSVIAREKVHDLPWDLQLVL